MGTYLLMHAVDQRMIFFSICSDLRTCHFAVKFMLFEHFIMFTFLSLLFCHFHFRIESCKLWGNWTTATLWDYVTSSTPVEKRCVCTDLMFFVVRIRVLNEALYIYTQLFDCVWIEDYSLTCFRQVVFGAIVLLSHTVYLCFKDWVNFADLLKSSFWFCFCLKCVCPIRTPIPIMLGCCVKPK